MLASLRWMSFITLGLFLVLLIAPTLSFAAETNTVTLNLDRLWVLAAACMVFMMQAGFLLFEIGVVRRKNVMATAMKNVIDWIVVSIAFFLVGFGVMFGQDTQGFIGQSFFALSGIELSDHALGYIFVVYQMAFAGTALTIVSGAMSERTGFIPYITFSLVLGMLIYPVFGHWAWGNHFIEGNSAWLADLGFMDFAGATVVHGIGAWCALIGVWMVGPRLGRYDEHGRMQDLKSYNIGLTALGVLLLWFGWWGFNGGSTYAMNDQVGLIILNTNMAGAGAALFAFFHCFFAQNRENLYDKTLGGALGGLVAVTASANIVAPLSALMIGAIAGMLHNYAYDLILKKMRLDDVVGAVPVHGVCGVWGTLAVALFGKAELLAHPWTMQLAVQAIGVITCMTWTMSVAYIAFKVLKMTVGLRVSPVLEQEGLSIIKEFDKTEMEEVDPDVLAMLLAKEGIGSQASSANKGDGGGQKSAA